MMWLAVTIGIIALILIIGRLITIRLVMQSYISHPPIGKFVDIGMSKVHYVEKGSGTPVIMIHGSDGTLFNFHRSIFELVSTEFHAIAVDRPGHGYSDTPHHRALTIPFHAEAVREAVARMGIRRPIVIGYSYGGAIALKWAAEHPEEIAGLVLISPAAYPERHYLAVLAYIAGIPFLGPLLVNTVFVPMALPQARIWAARAFRPDPLPAGVMDTVLAFSLRPKQFAAFAEEMRHFYQDLKAQTDQYDKITLPTAILAGEDDILLTTSNQAVRLQKTLPHATLRLFPNTGHELHHKHRQETLAAIREIAAKAMNE